MTPISSANNLLNTDESETFSNDNLGKGLHDYTVMKDTQNTNYSPNQCIQPAILSTPLSNNTISLNITSTKSKTSTPMVPVKPHHEILNSEMLLAKRSGTMSAREKAKLRAFGSSNSKIRNKSSISNSLNNLSHRKQQGNETHFI